MRRLLILASAERFRCADGLWIPKYASSKMSTTISLFLSSPAPSNRHAIMQLPSAMARICPRKCLGNHKTNRVSGNGARPCPVRMHVTCAKLKDMIDSLYNIRIRAPWWRTITYIPVAWRRRRSIASVRQARTRMRGEHAPKVATFAQPKDVPIASTKSRLAATCMAPRRSPILLAATRREPLAQVLLGFENPTRTNTSPCAPAPR